MLGKIGLGGGENNELVGNGLEDQYKQDRQQLIFVPNLFENNSWVDKFHNETASWITWRTESKGYEFDKSRRQKRKIYFKWNDVTSIGMRGIMDVIYLLTEWWRSWW